jgi:serine phosphatase RsbU (regulator of sigma subunit)
MTHGSITSTTSFQSRLLRSEMWRAALMAAVWCVLLAITLLRRALGGIVMSVDDIFFPTLAVLLFGILYEGVVFIGTRRCVREGRSVPRWRWIASVVIDLAIPIFVLTLNQLFSPRGGYAALSGPSLLALPLITMLSTLRLRPRVSLWTGIAAALSHWALVLVAIRAADIDRSHWPLLFAYGVMLATSGVAAMAIAAHARASVQEAVSEALAAEQTQRALLSIEHDLAVARDIQKGLMPSTTPNIPGFDIAGMARPAQHAGGDYYDWQPLPDGRLAVALADVTGHGIGPALVMAVCRAYARASARSAPDPPSLLSQISRLVYDDLSSTGRFITMVIAVVSPDGRIELVSAGHGPTLLYRAAPRSVEWFGGSGFPLGIDATEEYTPHTALRLEPGDVLLLLTDGFMEWMRASDRQQFGLERLKRALHDAAPGSARGILDYLDAAVQAFAEGSPQADDTTAVAIKRV